MTTGEHPKPTVTAVVAGNILSHLENLPKDRPPNNIFLGEKWLKGVGRWERLLMAFGGSGVKLSELGEKLAAGGVPTVIDTAEYKPLGYTEAGAISQTRVSFDPDGKLARQIDRDDPTRVIHYPPPEARENDE